jgi:hypothetical protein
MCLCKMVGKNKLKSLKKTLCRVYKKSTRQSDLNFAERPLVGARQRLAPLPSAWPTRGRSAKSLVFAECHLSGTRQRRCHGPKRRHGYFSLPSACPDTRQSLCRVPDKRHSAKTSLPEYSLPSAFCPVLHSAKPLPSVFGALPSVQDTRQRS